MTVDTKATRRTQRQPRSLAAAIDDLLKRAEADLGQEETVHDLRVTCRRLEAATRVSPSVLPEKRLRKVRRAAQAIRRAFDEARDLEVIAAELSAVAGLSASFLEGVTMAAAAPRAATSARKRIERELERLTTVRRSLDGNATPSRAAYALAVRTHIAAFFDELDRLLPESTDDALHEARISAKRLRYEMEIGRAVFPRLVTQVKRIKRLQDVLGRHQDAFVGLRWAEALAEGEMSATASDRAAVMRHYAALHRGQRSQLRRLLAGWREAEMRGRMTRALT